MWPNDDKRVTLHINEARYSLHEICGGLASWEGKLAQLGIEAPSRETLVYANAYRPWERYQHVINDLVAHCRDVAGTHRFRFKNSCCRWTRP